MSTNFVHEVASLIKYVGYVIALFLHTYFTFSGFASLVFELYGQGKNDAM
jgi:hypothetical protein